MEGTDQRGDVGGTRPYRSGVWLHEPEHERRIKPGAAVIDVGTNRVTDAKEAERFFRDFPDRLERFRAKGSALVGDVHPAAINIAGALTPVPGGVGPMTIAMLMSNTVKAARLRRASPKFSATQSTARAR